MPLSTKHNILLAEQLCLSLNMLKTMKVARYSLKSEVRNPNVERNPKPENRITRLAREFALTLARQRSILSGLRISGFCLPAIARAAGRVSGILASDFFRVSAIRISDFRPNPSPITRQVYVPQAVLTGLLGLLGLLVLLAGAETLRAGNLYLPNASFAAPVVPETNPYAVPDMAAWEKSAQPAWYDPSQNDDTPWADLMGTFYNVPFPGEYIDNCDGSQAAFIFALPGAAIFQDYDSLDDASTNASHAFNAKFNVGRSYNLTVGVIGGGGGMQPGATLQLSLYYRDAFSNLVIVAATTITNSTTMFPTNTHLVDFQVQTPTVQPGDAWAGQNLGVQIASTVGFDIPGGYWDVDNVRLVEEIIVPNYSFESPVVPEVNPYAIPDLAAWEKSAQPAWYDPSQNDDTPWADLMGTFYNVPFPGEYIDNCDGAQAAFLFALPDVAIYQDYNSMDDGSTNASHAFNVTYTVGKAYTLTVGVLGGGGGMPDGATLQLSLYYRDAFSNQVTVAATTITNRATLFPTNTHLVDFQVQIPGIQATDPWAGQNIGIQLLSTANFGNSGGYWDVDNVRLTEVVAPQLSHPVWLGGNFNLTLQSDPGTLFEILGMPCISSPPSDWTSLVTFTNTTGAILFSDPAAGLNQRFYSAHQLP